MRIDKIRQRTPIESAGIGKLALFIPDKRCKPVDDIIIARGIRGDQLRIAAQRMRGPLKEKPRKPPSGRFCPI